MSERIEINPVFQTSTEPVDGGFRLTVTMQYPARELEQYAHALLASIVSGKLVLVGEYPAPTSRGRE